MKESEAIRIEGFKKEFRAQLLTIKNRDLSRSGHREQEDVELMEEDLDVTRVALLMNKMGFL